MAPFGVLKKKEKKKYFMIENKKEWKSTSIFSLQFVLYLSTPELHNPSVNLEDGKCWKDLSTISPKLPPTGGTRLQCSFKRARGCNLVYGISTGFTSNGAKEKLMYQRRVPGSFECCQGGNEASDGRLWCRGAITLSWRHRASCQGSIMLLSAVWSCFRWAFSN